MSWPRTTTPRMPRAWPFFRRRGDGDIGVLDDPKREVVKIAITEKEKRTFMVAPAPKTKKGLKDSIDDVLGDLLGDETTLPEKPVKLAACAKDNTGVAQTLPSARAGTKSLLEDDAFSTMAGLAGDDAEVSDISEADPQALLQTMKDLDDMDADLLGLKKSHLASGKSAAKGSGKEELPSNPKPAGVFTANEKGDAIPSKKPSPSPSSFGHQYRKFSFEDKEDTWGDEDFLFGAYQPTVGSLGGRQSRRQSARFLAEGGTDLKGEPGSQQSTPAASSPIYPRKGGADWLGLKDDELGLLPPSPTREPRRGGSALSTPSVPHPAVPHPASRHSAPAGLPSSSSGAKPLPEGAGFPAKASPPSQPGASAEKEEEAWLSHTLSQKRSQGLAKEECTATSKGQNSAGEAGRPPSSSQPAASAQGLKQAAAMGTLGTAAQKSPAKPATSGSPVTLNQAALALRAGDPEKDTAPGVFSGTEPVMCVPSSQEPTGLPVPVQALLPESLARSLLPGTEYQKQLLAAQVQLQTGTAELQAELLQSQARLAELAAQVRKLELERAQHELLLRSLQQRHQADLDLIENAHRSRVKVLETSYQQREERLRRENEELSSQYLSHCQEAERARAELTAQYQRRLAAAAQEKDQEMERLRELQQASILDMRRGHEDQLQRLKLLKDREIDAVTSATSHTRSLNGIIEQMEKFSSSLSELSSRVEASHLTTTQEWEQGIRQRDEQLRALQETLGRQQRDTEEERSRFQEVVGRMETRLNEQSRLLEQERWRVSAEQSKAESTQRALEEQRKVMAQQMAIEREELERAKSALLEEQKSIMHKCGEERRRLAAEWAEFSAQQKLSKERAEREAERALKVDTQREGMLVSLAKEQAELKIRASELRAKEDQLAAEREALERERQELRLEKERVSAAALRIRLRAEEVDRRSQVASEKYEEGERALREARQAHSEQQARLHLVQEQQERLRRQEQRLHQEHLSMARQRLQLDGVRQDLPSSPMGLLAGAQGLATSGLSAIVAPAPANPAGLSPSHLHAKLLLLRHTAEQDRDFLENEQFFLETLKKAAYNMT